MNDTTSITIPTESTVSSAVSETTGSTTVTGVTSSNTDETAVSTSEIDITTEQEKDLSESSLNETDITDISEESISDVSISEIPISEPITLMTEIPEKVTELPTEVITLPKETTAAETKAAIVTETTAQATPSFYFENLNISPNVIIIAAIIIVAIIASSILKKMNLNRDLGSRGTPKNVTKHVSMSSAQLKRLRKNVKKFSRAEKRKLKFHGLLPIHCLTKKFLIRIFGLSEIRLIQKSI